MIQKVGFFIVCSVVSLFAETVSLSSKIPPYLWQTYKTTKLPPSMIEIQGTWPRLNPEYSCFLWDDEDIERYIQEKWPSEFLDFFQALPIGAMKADLWRYLILASEGGVYSDLDSVCLIPIQEWMIEGVSRSPHILFVDLDSDQSLFCQWTFVATPRHPAMYYVCYYVLNQWKQEKGLIMSPDGKIDVLKSTGPIVFSEAIKRYIGESIDTGASDILKRYTQDRAYRERLNGLGIFLAEKGFFDGYATENLFWGTWGHRSFAKDLEDPISD